MLTATCWAAQLAVATCSSQPSMDRRGKKAFTIEPRAKTVILLPLTLQGLNCRYVLHTQRMRVGPYLLMNFPKIFPR